MELLFLPVLVALLTGSVAYGIAYSRTRNRLVAGLVVHRNACWYTPLLLILMWPVFNMRMGHSGVDYIQFNNVAHDLFYGLLVGALLGYATLSFANWIGRRYPGYTGSMQRSFSDMIGLLLIAPVIEEIIFRGYGYDLSSTLGMTAGVLITSMAFALWHMNPYLTVPAFLFGLVASGLYLYTQSLFAPIVAHAVSNFAYWRWSESYRS
ncbi:MAG: CPBP family intramembrane metalloprotease [Gammaproteobacteria bacterium]|nr:CPBP family intramembrane metalloprotease [Gammaproteobacteria bacterium]